jgi:hypothetical protein
LERAMAGFDLTLKSPSCRVQKVRPGSNYSTNGYPSRVNTLTAPTGDGVVIGYNLPGNLVSADAKTPMLLKLWPYGVGAATNTMSLRVLGWDLLNGIEWIPTPLVEYQATLSTYTGLGTGGVLLSTELFADRATIAGGYNANVDTTVKSPANNTPCLITVDILGFPIVEVIFTTGGVATNCNALFAWL